MTSETSRPQDRATGKRARLRENLLLFVGVPFGWVALILGFVWLVTISEPFSIPSGSMMPTLLPGDYVMARENYYRSVEPARGDLVIHRVPGPGSRGPYIKRVIGLPGDEIGIINGLLHINGASVERTPDGSHVLPGHDGSPRTVPRYVETLPDGRAYRIIETGGDTSYGDNTEAFTVPPGHYFVLGNNRDNSLDSRHFGPVPAEYIRHRPLFIFWSKYPARIGKRVD